MLRVKNDHKVKKFSMQVSEKSDIEILFQDISTFIANLDVNKKVIQQQNISLKREELQAKERMAQTKLEIARENKNKYDVPQKNKSNNKDK